MAYPFAAAEVLTAVDLNAMIGAPTQNTQTGTTYTAVLLDAGKTVTLSNASAVTLTIPAQASVSWADNTQLNFLNIGAGTVTITAAAGVTINGTPLTLETSKGGSLVRTASNTWTFMPTGGGLPGLILVASGTVATASSISINDCFTSDYSHYKILFSTTAVSAANPGILMRLRVGGTDNSSSAYITERLLQSSTTVSGLQNPNGTNSWTVGVTDSTYPDRCGFEMTVFNPQVSQRTFGISQSLRTAAAGTPFSEKFGTTFTTSLAFDGFSLTTSSGTMSGTVFVYGLAKA